MNAKLKIGSGLARARKNHSRGPRAAKAKLLRPKVKLAREKERIRQLKKYHANKDRYAGRDIAAGLNYFWATRGGLPK